MKLTALDMLREDLEDIGPDAKITIKSGEWLDWVVSGSDLLDMVNAYRASLVLRSDPPPGV